jgi:hypothetical protein
LHPGTLRKVDRPADSGLTNTRVRRKVLAGRNPLLLLRFAGAFLLRLAERRFNGLLLKAPPRKERLRGRRPAEGVFPERFSLTRAAGGRMMGARRGAAAGGAAGANSCTTSRLGSGQDYVQGTTDSAPQEAAEWAVQALHEGGLA